MLMYVAIVFAKTIKILKDIMKYDAPYTTLMLMDELGMKSRASFRENYLVPALELNLIKMTISKKPKSKNMRCIKQ